MNQKTINYLNWMDSFSHLLPIIIDTNFFIHCIEKKVHLPDAFDNIIDRGYKLLVPLSVVRELETLEQKNFLLPKIKLLIEKISIIIDEGTFLEQVPFQVDDQILALAIKLFEYSPIIASADNKLRKKAWKLEIPVITIKNRNLRISLPKN